MERPCPGETVTFTCTISSTAHQWRVPSLGISRALTPSSQQSGVISDPPFEFNVTEVVPGTSITSIAIVNITEGLNGTLIMCQDGNLVLPDQTSTISLRGEHLQLLRVHVNWEMETTILCVIQWELITSAFRGEGGL